MILMDVYDESKCCCSCEHNIRTWDSNGHCTCRCDIDNHYIGYVENFDTVCDEWKSDVQKVM